MVVFIPLKSLIFYSPEKFQIATGSVFTFKVVQIVSGWDINCFDKKLF